MSCPCGGHGGSASPIAGLWLLQAPVAAAGSEEVSLDKGGSASEEAHGINAAQMKLPQHFRTGDDGGH